MVVHPPSRARPGFTLMEMMTVISIITLLISMLLPSLAASRRSARSAQCRSHLHQQGLAIIAYTDLYNHYPGAHTWTHNGPENFVIWPSRLREFTQDKNPDWFWCPEGEPNAQWKISFGSGLPAKFGYRQDEHRLVWSTPFTYGYNNWGTRDFSVPQWGLGGLSEHNDWGELKAYRVVQPASMIAIGDSQVDGVWDAFIDTDQPQEFPALRHPGGAANIVYCDGHVDSMKLEHVLSPDWLPRWNNDGKFH